MEDVLMSKLDAVKCETSYFGNLLVTHILVIVVTILWTASNYQGFAQWFLWIIFIFVLSLVILFIEKLYLYFVMMSYGGVI